MVLRSNISLPFTHRPSYSLFPVDLSVKMLKALLSSYILATCPTHVNVLDLINLTSYYTIVGLCRLGVTCLPRDPGFAGSNSVEVDGFFQDVKILCTSPPGGTLSHGSQVCDSRLVKET